MLALPIAVIFLDGLTSFLVTCLIISLQGLANAIALSCFYSIISFLPFHYIIVFSTGQGIAGILMNVVRYILLLSLGSDANDKDTIILGSLIFFGISAIILTICLIFVFVVYKHPYFIAQMRNSGEFENLEHKLDYLALRNDLNTSDTEKEDKIINRVTVTSVKKIHEDSPQKAVIKVIGNKNTSFSYLMMLLLDLNFIIFVSYLCTFAVFPGIALAADIL